MDEETFKQALDANPADWATSQIYADWLEEQGRLDEAFTQRWMARRKKRPSPPGPPWTNDLDYVYHPPIGWAWWPGGDCDILSNIGNLANYIPKESRAWSSTRITQFEAIDDLRIALKKLGVAE